MFRALSGLNPRYYLAKPEDARGLDPAEIAAWMKGQGMRRPLLFKNPVAALRAARRGAGAGDLVLAWGSLYTVGAILGQQKKAFSGR
jgi:folylpolyglutamate synthase/dihydropteroate synthase